MGTARCRLPVCLRRSIGSSLPRIIVEGHALHDGLNRPIYAPALVFACACVSSDTPLVSIGFDFLNSNEQPSTNLLDLKNLALGKFNTWQLSVLRIILHIEICVRASLAVTPRKYRLQRQRSYFT